MAPSAYSRARSWLQHCNRRCRVQQSRPVAVQKTVKKVTSRKLASESTGALPTTSASRRRVSRNSIHVKQQDVFQKGSPASPFSVVCRQVVAPTGTPAGKKREGRVKWPPSFQLDGFAHTLENVLPPIHLRGASWPIAVPLGYRSPYSSDGRLLALCRSSKDDNAERVPQFVLEYGDQRVVRGGMRRDLEVFWVGATFGWGVRASETIEVGEFVCEYAGEILGDEEAETRGVRGGLGRDAYLFDLSTPALCRACGARPPSHTTPVFDDDVPIFVIDAFAIGSVARFINHACGPSTMANVSPIFVFSGDAEATQVDARLPRVALFANRNIAIGEELRYDYAMQPGDVGDGNGSDRRLACHCGSDVCRRRIY